jgi:glyceraldehyde 3-phosphate dehydrogenase
MATIKVGINGMGRIGRTVLREIINRNENIEVTAVNNPGDISPYIHLIKYDSVHGQAPFEIDFKEGASEFSINNKTIAFHGIKDPAEIPWSEGSVDIVIDATGIFKDKEGLGRHLQGGVKKVIMCAPGKDLDGTFVVGINHQTYDPKNHNIISNASCTTNCLSPVAKVLNDTFGIENGFMTTVHAYTSDQQLLDGSHTDFRRARAAAVSMIPTTTGAAKAVGMVIPELTGKLDGFAIRVPTPNVSLVDLNVNLKKKATIEEINQALTQASHKELKGVLKTEELPLVSIDFTGMRESSCVDLQLTNVIDGMAKVVSWYDNEAGFSNRVIDLAKYIGDQL